MARGASVTLGARPTTRGFRDIAIEFVEELGTPPREFDANPGTLER